MPAWPAYLMAGFCAACAYPALTTPPPVQTERYRAIGQEPGWTVDIQDDRIDYRGNYGETRITVRRPEARSTFNGRRYETQRLIVDVTYARCNDAMSGHGYEHQVMVIADGQTYRGCGGARRSSWDQ